MYNLVVRGVTHHNEFLISKFQQLITPPGVGVGERETNVVAPGLAVCDRCVGDVTHHNELLISKFQESITPPLTLIRIC